MMVQTAGPPQNRIFDEEGCWETGGWEKCQDISFIVEGQTKTFKTLFVNYFSDRIVSMQFMRKYIHVAKAITPALTRPASDLIAEEYAKLRSQDSLQQDNLARVLTFSFYLPIYLMLQYSIA